MAQRPETNMNYFDSTDRRTADYVLFALAFIGFLLAAGGVVMGSPPGALTGAIILLLAILCFSLRPSPGE